jgi:hypothetical protein
MWHLPQGIASAAVLGLALLPVRLTAQALGPTADAASAEPPRAHVPRFSTPPAIDGVLDEPVWHSAARLEGFVQTRPGDNTAPSHATVVLVGYDARTLYLGIQATDDSALVRATVAARDDILNDDFVGIFLDTFGDRRRAYVLGFNPLGIQQDGIYTEGVVEPDYSVDIVMFSKGRVDRNGWTVEVAIPLSSLRYSAGPGHRWNAHVQRRIKHLNNEQDSWMPMVRGDAGFLTQAGSLAGFDALPTRRAVELIPSITALREGTRVPASDPGSPVPDAFADAPARAAAGLSAKLGLAADVTAELALNPDFAQVEADAPIVTANQRYPILFEEKRPFFLEGIDLFRTPLLVVHTRAIVDPAAAVKLTGKRGGTAFGVLAASDGAPGYFTDAERRDSLRQAEVARLGGRHSLVGIVRLRHEVGAASHIGFLGTAYHFVDRDNLTAGADFRVAGGTRAVAIVQLTGTWARRTFYDPDRDRDTLRTGRGLGYHAELRSTSRHLNLTLTGRGRSPDYVSETGFAPQVNNHVWSLETRWDAEPRPAALLHSWSAMHTVLAWFDWKGRMTYGYVWPHATFNFPRLTSVTVGAYMDYLRLFEEEFGPRRNAQQTGAFAGPGVRQTVYRGFAITGGTTPDRRWKLAWTFDWSWDAFDYDFGGGPKFPRVSPAALADPNAPLDPGKGNTFDATVSVMWGPAAVLRFGATYTKSRLRRNDTHRVAYDENLWSAQAVYQLSRFTSARVRADYRSSRSNLRPQVLLAWTPNPGTALYAGYNDDFNSDGYSPITGAREPGLRRNARTLFVKLSYLVRWGTDD